jgi:hypothetical protein
MMDTQEARFKTRFIIGALKAGNLVVFGDAIIKLKDVSYNALGWPVWDFTVLAGIPKRNVFFGAPFDPVEVLLPVIGEDQALKIPKIARPHHVYVQLETDSDGYEVYRFARQVMAEAVRDCATRFGLTSFIVHVPQEA